ncbi:MAG TPA: GNAT family N-acetyltransferase [Streptosporangiaceae bacterium]|nr:GNAT family N-acetyltransferase [Streptosporangiaceae bacterium]
MKPHAPALLDTHELAVTETADPADLRRLLRLLAQENCVHSWRNFGIDGTLDELLAWENRQRPTKIFFFYSARGSEARMVGAGAVSDSLTGLFPSPGFCVLSRCYVVPEYRGHGMYRLLLQYRMEYCRKEFGDALNGVHIGSANDRIARVLLDHRMPGWPTFAHLGEEELRISGAGAVVGAYMLLMPGYVRRIERELSGSGAPESVLELRRTLAELGAGQVRGLGLLVQRARDDATAAGWFRERGSEAIDQLLRFCRSIPLVSLT